MVMILRQACWSIIQYVLTDADWMAFERHFYMTMFVSLYQKLTTVSADLTTALSATMLTQMMEGKVNAASLCRHKTGTWWCLKRMRCVSCILLLSYVT